MLSLLLFVVLFPVIVLVASFVGAIVTIAINDIGNWYFDKAAIFQEWMENQ